MLVPRNLWSQHPPHVPRRGSGTQDPSKRLLSEWDGGIKAEQKTQNSTKS